MASSSARSRWRYSAFSSTSSLPSAAMSSPVGGDHQRVDLAGHGVERDRQPVQGLYQRHQRGGELPGTLGERGHAPQRGEGELADLEGLGAAEGVGPELGDHLRLSFGDLLDVHPAGAGEDEHHAPAVAVEGDAAVELVGDVEAGLAPDAAHRVALDVHGEDPRRLGARLLGGVDDGDAAGLAAAADRHLGLHRHPAQLARGRLGLLRGAGQAAGGDGDARLRELLLRLVLEELHRGAASCSCPRTRRRGWGRRPPGRIASAGSRRALAAAAASPAPSAAGCGRRAGGRAPRRWRRRGPGHRSPRWSG